MLYHISVLLQNFSDLEKMLTHLLALVPFYLAPLLGEKALLASPPLSPAVLCRHCSLSRLLCGFQDGQINFTICKMLGEIAFSRMATNIFTQVLENNTGFWQIMSHAEIGDSIKNYIFWSFYK